MTFTEGVTQVTTLFLHPTITSVTAMQEFVASSYSYLYIITCTAILAGLGYLYRKEFVEREKLEKVWISDQLYINKVVKEKEWLLREINHRVKNNLQIMISLLNSQQFFLRNREAVDAIKNSQRRLHAISLAYQKGYDPINPSDIDMNLYITDLIDYLMDEYKIDSHIHCDLEIESTLLPITSAVPIGMILSEALSNSFQYAFTPHAEGMIKIKFISTDEEGSYKLLISDNGVGMPTNFEAAEISSLGTSLMQGLSRQLRGELLLNNDNGVSITVEFTNLKS
jgi:two-component sensor histidine kinase